MKLKLQEYIVSDRSLKHSWLTMGIKVLPKSLCILPSDMCLLNSEIFSPEYGNKQLNLFIFTI